MRKAQNFGQIISRKVTTRELTRKAEDNIKMYVVETCVRIWTGLKWFMVGSSVMALWTRFYVTGKFPDQPFQEGSCIMELFIRSTHH